MLAQETFATG